MGRTRLSEDERAARREADRQKAREAVEALKTSDGWQRWLSLRRHFRTTPSRISSSSRCRSPDATRVAGFRAWLKLGYAVRRGERAIRIWNPCPAVEEQARRVAARRCGSRGSVEDVVPPRPCLRPLAGRAAPAARRARAARSADRRARGRRPCVGVASTRRACRGDRLVRRRQGAAERMRRLVRHPDARDRDQREREYQPAREDVRPRTRARARPRRARRRPGVDVVRRGGTRRRVGRLHGLRIAWDPHEQLLDPVPRVVVGRSRTGDDRAGSRDHRQDRAGIEQVVEAARDEDHSLVTS